MSGHGDARGTEVSTLRMRFMALIRHPAFAAAATLAIVLATALGTWWLVREQSLQTARGQFEQRTAHITNDLQQELATCEYVLRSASGLFAVSPAITPQAWRQYVTRLDMDDTLPTVRALGYAALGPGAAAALSEGRNPNNTGGRAPQTSAQPFAPVTLMTPLRSGAPAAGYDLGRDPTRRAALLRALQSGELTLDALAPQAGAAEAPESHLELYLPVYRGAPADAAPAPRGDVTGVLVAVVDPRRVFQRGVAHQWGVALQVFAGSPATAIYTSEPAGDAVFDTSPIVRKTETLRFGGEPLTLVYTTSEHYLAAGNDSAAMDVLVAGLISAVLLAGLAWLVARERSGISGETRQARTLSSLNEARMMGIIRSSMEAIITIDESQRIVIFNPMAERLFGTSAMEAIGTPLSRFIPERLRAAHARHVDQFGVTGVSDRQMGHQRVLFGLRASGEEFPIEASISQIRDGNGKLYTVMLRDVTERVKADNAQRKAREELRELSANLQKVREEEKTRIARELHDDLGQQLTALKMDLSAVETALDTQGGAQPELFDQLRGMRWLIDATVASVRRIAADLRPVMLDDLGLIPAIEWLVHDFHNRYCIEVERHFDVAETSFSRNGATTVFRIVQEALTNVARHAEATLVSLTIRVGDGTCVLRIADNGRGADQQSVPAEKSFGLLGIRERAHMLGGSVEIHTGNGAGFAITVTFPQNAVEEQEAQS